MDHFLVFMNLLQYFFCFMSWSFGCQACGIVASQPGIKLSPPALEGKVLTTEQGSPNSVILF